MKVGKFKMKEIQSKQEGFRFSKIQEVQLYEISLALLELRVSRMYKEILRKHCS